MSGCLKEATGLDGSKADVWFLKQNSKVMNLPFKPEIKWADRDNTIDVYVPVTLKKYIATYNYIWYSQHNNQIVHD